MFFKKSPVLPPQRLLFVDDNVRFLCVIPRYFRDQGQHTTYVIQHPEKVIPWLRRNDVDAIILDIQMSTSGFDLLEQIKPEVSRVPIIFLSGQHYTKALQERVKASGAIGFVSKGIPIGDIYCEITNLLQRHRKHTLSLHKTQTAHS